MIANLHLRKCDECGRGMSEGYLADGLYYCSNNCLHRHHSPDEWESLTEDGDSDDYYYTEWHEYEPGTEETLFTNTGTPVPIEE